MREKMRELRIWIREQGYSFYVLIALLLFLIIKCFFDLDDNLQHFYGSEEIDFFPNKIAFFLLVLWAFQAALFYKRTNKITSSALFLALFGLLLAAYFLAAYAWTCVIMFRDFFAGRHSLYIPIFNDYYIFLSWVGNEVWRLNFPWGGIVFPLLIFLFYATFILCFLFYLKLKNKASLCLLSLLCLGLSLLLISSLMESLMIIKTGVGISEISSLDTFGRFLIEKFYLKPIPG